MHFDIKPWAKELDYAVFDKFTLKEIVKKVQSFPEFKRLPESVQRFLSLNFNGKEPIKFIIEDLVLNNDINAEIIGTVIMPMLKHYRWSKAVYQLLDRICKAKRNYDVCNLPKGLFNFICYRTPDPKNYLIFLLNNNEIKNSMIRDLIYPAIDAIYPKQNVNELKRICFLIMQAKNEYTSLLSVYADIPDAIKKFIFKKIEPKPLEGFLLEDIIANEDITDSTIENIVIPTIRDFFPGEYKILFREQEVKTGPIKTKTELKKLLTKKNSVFIFKNFLIDAGNHYKSDLLKEINKLNKQHGYLWIDNPKKEIAEAVKRTAEGIYSIMKNSTNVDFYHNTMCTALSFLLEILKFFSSLDPYECDTACLTWLKYSNLSTLSENISDILNEFKATSYDIQSCFDKITKLSPKLKDHLNEHFMLGSVKHLNDCKVLILNKTTVGIDPRIPARLSKSVGIIELRLKTLNNFLSNQGKIYVNEIIDHLKYFSKQAIFYTAENTSLRTIDARHLILIALLNYLNHGIDSNKWVSKISQCRKVEIGLERLAHYLKEINKTDLSLSALQRITQNLSASGKSVGNFFTGTLNCIDNYMVRDFFTLFAQDIVREHKEFNPRLEITFQNRG